MGGGHEAIKYPQQSSIVFDVFVSNPLWFGRKGNKREFGIELQIQPESSREKIASKLKGQGQLISA